MALGADPVSFSVVFAAGFVSFASPCVLPLVPGYLAFVSGIGLNANEGEGPKRSDVAIPTLAFVAGFAGMFALLGASAGFLGNFLLEERRTLEIAGGVFVIAMGLLLLGRGIPNFLMQERRMQLTKKPATLAGSALAGVAFAVGWTPCIGPTLAAALTIAASGGQPALGAALLFVFALGLGLPFLIAGLFMQQATSAMGFLKRHLNVISTTGAVVLIVFGVMLATGEMAQLTTRLSGFAPAI
jgi:cytochrome c-type biogenesis protein